MLHKVRSFSSLTGVGFQTGEMTDFLFLSLCTSTVGLLPRSNMEYVDFAYKLYESKKDEDVKRARGFKRTFSVHVEVEFVGVW